MKSKKYRPYIRRLNGKEKADDLRTAFRLAFFGLFPKAYVLVQHGFPKSALAVGRSKKDVVGQIPAIVWQGKTFKQYSKDVQKYCMIESGEWPA